MQKTISLHRYWNRRVVYPTVSVFALLLILLFSTLFLFSRSAEEKHQKAVIDTLSMVLAEPILTGDFVELTKRVSAVAKHHSLRIQVDDEQHHPLIQFPSDLDSGTDSSNALFSKIESSDGRVLGFISAIPLSHNFLIEPILFALVFFFFALGALLIWIMISLAPLVLDIETLSKSSEDHLGNIFRFSEIQDAHSKILNQSIELRKASNDRALAALSRQVAHDIRSPLSALHLATLNLSGLASIGEETRILLRSACSRITDIANSLNDRSKTIQWEDIGKVSANSKLRAEFLSPLVERVVSEKRIQYRDHLQIDLFFEQDHTAYGIFAKVDSMEFSRLVSNLIQNSIEAFPDHDGTVSISLERVNNSVILRIRDNGVGIPDSVINKIGARGATFGKANGSGLGLFHAKQSVEGWGGTLCISSKVSEGTTIIVELPQSSSPDWFAPSLRMNAGARIAILDDDVSIHHIWKKRFELLPVDLMHFSSVKTFEDWLTSIEGKEQIDIFLCDYELIGSSKNGLDIITENRLEAVSILVTSHFDDPAVLRKCATKRIAILPKSSAYAIPIKLYKLPSDAFAYPVDNELEIES